jgi:hypothetical protein
VARQAANRLLGNGCSYVPNFEHSEVLIRMTDVAPLLLAPRDEFVTLNIFDKKFTVDFPNKRGLNRMDSFSVLVDLFARGGLVPAYSLVF